MKTTLKKAIKNIPVCINNYYGDPVIQWDNTINKLKKLADEKHEGIVSIITRGFINDEKAKELAEITKNLKFLVIVSVSELPERIEPLSHKERYQTIKNLKKAGIKVLPNVRPIIPEENGRPEVLESIFKNLADSGVDHIIISGFRGDDNLIDKMDLDKKIEWSLRIKIITPEINKIINDLSKKYNIRLSRRVACGVATEFMKIPDNPYYLSPQLVGCDSCPNYLMCQGAISRLPDPKLIDFLRKVGYDFEYTIEVPELCQVEPTKRTECPSCCTACYINKGPKIRINPEQEITLGDTAFIRFLTGVIGTQDGIYDPGGDTATAKVISNFVGRPVHLVNSWYVWSRQLNKCYGCTYCITEAYKIEEKDFGSSPEDLYNEIVEKMEEKGLLDD